MEPQAVVELLNSMDNQTASSVISSVLEARPELAPGIVSFAVPDLTYAPAKALTERRSKGIIRGLSPQQPGLGLIACPELQLVFGCDVIVQGPQLGGFQVGQEVTFAVVLSKDNRPQAFDLQESGAAAAGLGHHHALRLQQQQPGLLLPQLQQVGIPGPGVVPLLDGATIPGLFGTLPSSATAFLGPAGPLASHPGALMVGGLPGGCCPASPGVGGFPGQAVPKASTGRKRPRPEESSILGTFEGVVKQFSAGGGFGFVSSEGVRALGHRTDVFLHHSEVGGCEVGSRVAFTCFLNSKGSPEAMDLRPLQTAAAASSPAAHLQALLAAAPPGAAPGGCF